MICQEGHCEVPICSSCILFGDHKGHRYIEKEKFFKNIEMKRKGLARIFSEIENAERKLTTENDPKTMVLRVNARQSKMEREIEFNCAKAIRQIENRKLELEKENKMYFEELSEKLMIYIKQIKDCQDMNSEWKKQMKEVMRSISEKSINIENCFIFSKKSLELELGERGRRTLDAIQEIQEILDQKVEESLRSFELKLKEMDDQFIQISRNKIIFEKDLRSKMMMILGEKQPDNFDLDFGNEECKDIEPQLEEEFEDIEEHEHQPNYRASDLMRDEFEQESPHMINKSRDPGNQYISSDMYADR